MGIWARDRKRSLAVSSHLCQFAGVSLPDVELLLWIELRPPTPDTAIRISGRIEADRKSEILRFWPRLSGFQISSVSGRTLGSTRRTRRTRRRFRRSMDLTGGGGETAVTTTRGQVAPPQSGRLGGSRCICEDTHGQTPIAREWAVDADSVPHGVAGRGAPRDVPSSQARGSDRGTLPCPSGAHGPTLATP
jgi:hypothetical protein